MKRKTIAEAFDEQYIIDSLTECYVWQRHRDKDGYGILTVTGKKIRAHRFAYERKHGPILEGLLGCHACDNPPCVNPEHIWLGTQVGNKEDAASKGRVLRGEAHGCAILTADRVLAIREKLTGGARPLDVAQAFNVSKHVIFCIQTRRSWTHL